MSKKLRWGVLSTAKIGVTKTIPGMQQGTRTEVAAIASRDLARAQSAAAKLGIPKAYGSYKELLADPDIDAIYNPLPNHLHVPWTLKAAATGKHVLCEKPLGLNAAEAATLIEAGARHGVKIGEAFMIRTHPQWLRAHELIEGGRIGPLRAIVGYFSYFNADPANIRNQPELGGGALMDVGCYLVHVARHAFAAEPRCVFGLVDRDQELGTDRLTSAMIEFPTGHCVFTCSTQLVPAQRVHFMGTRGRIEIEVPFNAPPDHPTRIFIDDGKDASARGAAVETFPVCNQYALQGDAFARAVLDGAPLPVPLEDSVKNMAVIDAIFKSAETGAREWPS